MSKQAVPRAERQRPTVLVGVLGSQLDGAAADDPHRWQRWRPTVDACRQDDLVVDRLVLIHEPRHAKLAELTASDVAQVSPETEVRLVPLSFDDPWDFEEVYARFLELATELAPDPQRERWLVHVTTGTHVQQICLFLLTESRHLPGRLLQSSPPQGRRATGLGRVRIIDLDLSRYDRLAQRFHREQQDAVSFLKGGIATRNEAFNALVERIEYVAVRSRDPILLLGPTGAGKSSLARRVHELKVQRRQVEGAFVEVNCATLRGDAAMSTLFGHVRGAFTGAAKDRDGLLRGADGGIVFLDEIGDLGLDEQAMLLRALEEKRFLPLGADREVASEFQLIAGTNRDLRARVRDGRFREDLLARIDLWTFELPGLHSRPEDVEPNLDHELDRHARERNRRVAFNAEARRRFVSFATSPTARWPGNFRDFNASLTRLATLAPDGRITQDLVDDEIAHLERTWSSADASDHESLLRELLGPERLRETDLFDRCQLAGVVRACRESRSLSEAGRRLFAASRRRRRSTNDADRLRKYLARHGLSWDDVTEGRRSG